MFVSVALRLAVGVEVRLVRDDQAIVRLDRRGRRQHREVQRAIRVAGMNVAEKSVPSTSAAPTAVVPSAWIHLRRESARRACRTCRRWRVFGRRSWSVRSQARPVPVL